MESARDKGERLLIPPFEDGHIHFTIDGKPPSDAEGTSGIREMLLSRGIMSVREMGHKTGIGLEAKRLAEDSPLRVRASGYALYRKGTYGVFLGWGVEDRRQIPGMVREIARSGAEILKVVNSGIISPRNGGMVTPGGFSPEEMRIICSEARERGLEIACHVNGDGPIREAVEAGVSSIEHGFLVSPDTLRLMLERGTSWTPTVYALSRIGDFIPPGEIGTLRRIIEGQLSSVRLAASLGVRLRIGTDSGSKGVAHGVSFIEELRLFRSAGLSLDRILSAACLEKGKIEKGNYLVVERDFITTGRIEEIVCNGKLLFQEGA